MLHKAGILFRSIRGLVYKWLVDLGVLKIPSLIGNGDNIVVSLTSYGRRVKACVVYYTIVSLLRQSKQPDRIILWLGDEEWNDSILPQKISTLCEKNVEIRYCKDLRSYKKLIPTLKICPNATVITVDDDVIYSRDTIESFLKVHFKYPKDIICGTASRPIISAGIPQQYHLWRECEQECAENIFPVGAGGILYPANSLHPEVINEHVFLQLCSYADDIWFWFCGLRNGSVQRFVKKSKKDLSYDALYQCFHKGSALTHTNRIERQNDKQFLALFEYYGVIIDGQGRLQKNDDPCVQSYCK